MNAMTRTAHDTDQPRLGTGLFCNGRARRLRRIWGIRPSPRRPHWQGPQLPSPGRCSPTRPRRSPTSATAPRCRRSGEGVRSEGRTDQAVTSPRSALRAAGAVEVLPVVPTTVVGPPIPVLPPRPSNPPPPPTGRGNGFPTPWREESPRVTPHQGRPGLHQPSEILRGETCAVYQRVAWHRESQQLWELAEDHHERDPAGGSRPGSASRAVRSRSRGVRRSRSPARPRQGEQARQRDRGSGRLLDSGSIEAAMIGARTNRDRA